MTTEIKNWLIKEYKEAGVEGLQIDSLISAIQETLKTIEEEKFFDKRFNVSKNTSVLMYESKSVEVHISIARVLSTYKLFKPKKERKFFVQFTMEEVVWNKGYAEVSATSKDEAYQKVCDSIEYSNPYKDFQSSWDGENTVTEEIVDTNKYCIGEEYDCTVEDVKVYRPTTIKQLIAEESNKNYYNFMSDGVVMVKFVDDLNDVRVTIQIQKLPSRWTNELALSLGYSNNPLAYKSFSGFRRIIEFIESFSVQMEINFNEKIVRGA